MSDCHLPEDPARWPTDPFAVLGVDRQVDRQELRRAYHRLIRRFKPDHCPAEFRRIRDAYEHLSQYLEFREYRVFEAPAAKPEPADEADEPATAPPADGAERPDEPKSVPAGVVLPDAPRRPPIR